MADIGDKLALGLAGALILLLGAQGFLLGPPLCGDIAGKPHQLDDLTGRRTYRHKIGLENQRPVISGNIKLEMGHGFAGQRSI